MAYEVKISEFEGPLDLLIHLIKKSNIDIYDIKIEEVTKQYLAYIKQMEKINLNIASEYLIMATELIEIKSNSLLPIKEIIADDEEDLRNNLISRLLEYKNYKETVSSFKKLEALRKCFFTKPPSDLETCGLDIKPLLNDELVVNDLLFAFNNVMKHKKFIEPISTRVVKSHYAVSKRVDEIRKQLFHKKRVDFIDLFDVFTKEYFIVTFLAMLDLANREEIIIKQDDNFEKILLILKGSD